MAAILELLLQTMTVSAAHCHYQLFLGVYVSQFGARAMDIGKIGQEVEQESEGMNLSTAICIGILSLLLIPYIPGIWVSKITDKSPRKPNEEEEAYPEIREQNISYFEKDFAPHCRVHHTGLVSSALGEVY